MRLGPGYRAVGVGCGHGRSLSLISAAVGDSGHVFGVDLSARMLKRAYANMARRNVHDVSILHTDFNACTTPKPLSAMLFSFSLTTFGRPDVVLRHAWDQLQPGGRLVVVDGQ